MPNEKREPKLCGAKTRKGTPCKRYAMDNGRCILHGGRNVNDKRGLKVPGRPITHGLYSRYARGSIAELAKKYLEDKNFLSLKEEIAVTRALLSRILENIDANSEPEFDDTRNLAILTDSIRKLVESFVKIESTKRFALSPDEVARVMRAVADIIKKYVTDEELYEKIRREILQIKY